VSVRPLRCRCTVCDPRESLHGSSLPSLWPALSCPPLPARLVVLAKQMPGSESPLGELPTLSHNGLPGFYPDGPETVIRFSVGSKLGQDRYATSTSSGTPPCKSQSKLAGDCRFAWNRNVRPSSPSCRVRQPGGTDRVGRRAAGGTRRGGGSVWVLPYSNAGANASWRDRNHLVRPTVAVADAGAGHSYLD
jgi:hypothetical protein